MTIEVSVEHTSLSQYLSRIQTAIRVAMPDQCWVAAELSDIKHRPNGNVFLEILESKNGKEVAKARCTMFGNVAAKVLKNWIEVTGAEPQPGMRVLLYVKTDFSPQYGLGLIVSAIDPSYTLGDMQAKVQRIIFSLKEKGMFDLQRKLTAPNGYWRIAVIAPHEAAGLADFRRDAELIQHNSVCQFEYFTATFQGNATSQTLKDALLQVHEQHKQEPFDVVCVIRGGGAKADLAWLNDLNLAAWMCRLPIPIYTGIGHEIDECVLDLVAHRKFDTPSKVIGFIRACLVDEASKLRSSIERGNRLITELVSRQVPTLDFAQNKFAQKTRDLLHSQQKTLTQAQAFFERGNSRLIGQEQLRLQRTSAEFLRLGLQQCETEQKKLLLKTAQAKSLTERLISKESARLTLACTLYEKTNPLALLNRGFAVVRDQKTGSIINTAQQAALSGSLVLSFADGKVQVNVD